MITPLETAYLACFHAAGHIPLTKRPTAKTHGGVQTEFSDCRRMDDRSDPELRAFLTTAYHYKSSSDYETGPEDNPSPEEARKRLRPPGASWPSSPF